MILIEKLKVGAASGTVEKLPYGLRLLLWIIRATGRGPLAYKLRFYHKLIDFVRVIVVHIVMKNGLENGFRYVDDPTLGHLADLVAHFGLGTKDGDHIQFNNSPVNKVHGEGLKSFVNDPDLSQMSVKGIGRKALNNYAGVFDLVRLYRNRTFHSKNLKRAGVWRQLLADGVLDYEVRLAETLFQLTQWEQGKKIPSPFDEAYYSESGRNAFENFTRHRFIKILNELPIAERNGLKVLDVGCGYGNYIHAVQDWNEEALVHGFELQKELYEEGKKRFETNDRITLFNQNILSYKTDEKYDLILLNYVLFYFSQEEKVELFNRLKEVLSSNGRILICQYYAGIEPLKYRLASAQNENSVSRRIEMFYGNKILYANAFWNQVASTFSEAERWTEFLNTLKSCEMGVKRITNADRFYYSLFLEVQREI